MIFLLFYFFYYFKFSRAHLITYVITYRTHISRSAVEQEISLNFKLVGLFGQLVGDEDIRDATIATSVPIPTFVPFLHSTSVLIYSAPVCCAQCQAHMSADQTKCACSTDNVMQVHFL